MDEFERAVEDIYSAIDGKVDKDTIRKELRKWLTQFQVGMAEAKRGVISKYGGDTRRISGNYRKISDLKPGEGRVDLRAKVLSINPKEYEVDGVMKKMYYGMIGDETGVIPFTAWNLSTEIRKGDCVEIKNAYTREWQGQTKLMIGQNTRIELLPPDSVTVKVEVKPAKIVELHPRMGLVEVIAKVMSVEKRNVEVDGEPREIYSGILADDTGEIPFTSWDVPVQSGEVLRISGAYVSTFRGMPQLVFDTRSEVKREDVEIEVHEIPVQIESLEGRGGFNVLLEGVIIDVKDGSGLIYRCPECGRVLNKKGECPNHGKVKANPDLRIKAILDDGTGAVMCLFNREQTERILGKSLDEVIEIVKENLGNPGIVMERIEDRIIARPMRVRGNVMNDEKFGLRMLVKDFEMMDMNDIAKKAEQLLDELGGW